MSIIGVKFWLGFGFLLQRSLPLCFPLSGLFETELKLANEGEEKAGVFYTISPQDRTVKSLISIQRLSLSVPRKELNGEVTGTLKSAADTWRERRDSWNGRKRSGV